MIAALLLAQILSSAPVPSPTPPSTAATVRKETTKKAKPKTVARASGTTPVPAVRPAKEAKLIEERLARVRSIRASVDALPAGEAKLIEERLTRLRSIRAQVDALSPQEVRRRTYAAPSRESLYGDSVDALLARADDQERILARMRHEEAVKALGGGPEAEAMARALGY